MRISSRNTSSALLCAALFTATAVLAQPAHPAPTAHTAHTSPAAHTGTTSASHAPAGCITIPDLSPKLPPPPAGSPCPKALYIMVTVPDVRIDYVNPVEGDLAKTLGLEPTSFTLAYIDTKAGAGEVAQPHKYYTVKYTGYLADGTVFDASDKHAETADGFTFQAGGHQVVAGWDTGFAGMHIGGKRRLYIPFQLAYGPNGRAPVIPARAELIFDMELVSQSDTPPAPKAPPAPPAATTPKPAATAPASAPATPATTQPATPPATESK